MSDTEALRKEISTLRNICKSQTEQILETRLDLLTLQTCLIGKGLIAHADLIAAMEKTHRESKTALASLASTKRGKPN